MVVSKTKAEHRLRLDWYMRTHIFSEFTMQVTLCKCSAVNIAIHFSVKLQVFVSTAVVQLFPPRSLDINHRVPLIRWNLD